MDSSQLIRFARRRRGLTLRALAERAGTSHSTLSAYETGTKAPSVVTLDRVMRAAGFVIDAELEQRVTDDGRRGRELEDVLHLAEQFPARHADRHAYPRFTRVT